MSAPTVPYFSFSELAKQVWWYPVVRGLVAVVLGVILMAFPVETVVVLVRLVGAFLVIDGVVGLVDGLRERTAAAPGWGWRVAAGAVGVLLGGALLIWPKASIAVLAAILGAWAVIGGLLAVVSALGIRRVPGSGWAWSALWGAATLAFGLVLLLAPLSGVAAIAWTVGLYAVLSGAVLVAAGFTVRALGKRAAAQGL